MLKPKIICIILFVYIISLILCTYYFTFVQFCDWKVIINVSCVWLNNKVKYKSNGRLFDMKRSISRQRIKIQEIFIEHMKCCAIYWFSMKS